MEEKQLESLPQGWVVSRGGSYRSRWDEYDVEMPVEHPLAGVRVELIAHSVGVDDVLMQHLDEPDRFSVVHLSWSGQRELPNHPTLEFTGTFAEFVGNERRQLELE